MTNKDMARVTATLNLLGLLKNPKQYVHSNSLRLIVERTVDIIITFFS